ncbi:MAG: hypothetical protein V1800_17905 [Candidatus Latescibacterota bacterium]
MHTKTIRDRFWLWGMKVNALQETSDYAALDFGTSSLTVEQAIERTGARNVIMAGNLPIAKTSLDAMPSAERIICKWSLHKGSEGKNVMGYEECLSRLMAAKELAASDPRIEGFLVDDFSTGSVEVGVKPEHLSRLQHENAVCGPHLPLGGTIYTMSLERPELRDLLPFFAHYVIPLWHADQITTLPASVDRLFELSGGKPMLLCLYVFDFGKNQPMSREKMERQLDVAEQLLHQGKVTGLAICGTCMMDLDWEANHCLYQWLERVGDREIANPKFA